MSARERRRFAPRSRTPRSARISPRAAPPSPPSARRPSPFAGRPRRWTRARLGKVGTGFLDKGALHEEASKVDARFQRNGIGSQRRHDASVVVRERRSPRSAPCRSTRRRRPAGSAAAPGGRRRLAAAAAARRRGRCRTSGPEFGRDAARATSIGSSISGAGGRPSGRPGAGCRSGGGLRPAIAARAGVASIRASPGRDGNGCSGTRRRRARARW